MIPAFIVTMASAERRGNRELGAAKEHLARISESVRLCGCFDDGDGDGDGDGVVPELVSAKAPAPTP